MDGLCKACGMAMDIDRAIYEAEGDASPDTRTLLYHVPLYRCRNPTCAAFGQLHRGARVLLPLESEAPCFDVAQ